MLAFDIETTGLDALTNKVTVVCTQDFDTGECVAYEFARCSCANEHEKLVQEMATAFDRATSLCAFNGIRFDIPFLVSAFRLDVGRAQAWVLKTSDILEFSRLILSTTFSLDLLCQHNNIKTKSATGLEAVRMARDGEWERLRNYCADDVRILCDIYRRRMIVHPRSGATFDLADISEQGMYLQSKSLACNKSSEGRGSTDISVADTGRADSINTYLQCIETSSIQLDHTKNNLMELKKVLHSIAGWLPA